MVDQFCLKWNNYQVKAVYLMYFLPMAIDLSQNIHLNLYLGEPVLHFLGPSCLWHLCWCHPLLRGSKGTDIVLWIVYTVCDITNISLQGCEGTQAFAISMLALLQTPSFRAHLFPPPNHYPKVVLVLISRKYWCIQPFPETWAIHTWWGSWNSSTTVKWA